MHMHISFLSFDSTYFSLSLLKIMVTMYGKNHYNIVK